MRRSLRTTECSPPRAHEQLIRSTWPSSRATRTFVRHDCRIMMEHSHDFERIEIFTFGSVKPHVSYSPCRVCGLTVSVIDTPSDRPSPYYIQEEP